MQDCAAGAAEVVCAERALEDMVFQGGVSVAGPGESGGVGFASAAAGDGAVEQSGGDG